MSRPTIAGIHHLKFNVSNFDRSLDFYARALGAKRLPEFDHRRRDGELFAYILNIEHLGTYLELRASPERAAREAGLDLVTFSVQTHRDLLAWHDHLEGNGIRHSPVFTGGSVGCWPRRIRMAGICGSIRLKHTRLRAIFRLIHTGWATEI
ncbi:VOC family protein [Paraburkholderia sp. BR10954]|uniref:VOC family protein n=1 Tax=Paraburkholderia sp. BR10954 TaxID=3236995 RepID=UPI0034D16CD3